MFQVCYTRQIGRENGAELYDRSFVTAYQVRNNQHGYPHFLIFQDNQWLWVSAKYCRPIL